MIQEAWNPHPNLLQIFSNYNFQPRVSERRGGAIVNLSNTIIGFTKCVQIDEDMSGNKTRINENPYIWNINVYLRRNSKKLVRSVFNWRWQNLLPRDVQRSILIGDWNLDPEDVKDKCGDLLRALCKQSGMNLATPLNPTRRDKKIDFCRSREQRKN